MKSHEPGLCKITERIEFDDLTGLNKESIAPSDLRKRRSVFPCAAHRATDINGESSDRFASLKAVALLAYFLISIGGISCERSEACKSMPA